MPITVTSTPNPMAAIAVVVLPALSSVGVGTLVGLGVEVGLGVDVGRGVEVGIGVEVATGPEVGLPGKVGLVTGEVGLVTGEVGAEVVTGVVGPVPPHKVTDNGWVWEQLIMSFASDFLEMLDSLSLLGTHSNENVAGPQAETVMFIVAKWVSVVADLTLSNGSYPETRNFPVGELSLTAQKEVKKFALVASVMFTLDWSNWTRASALLTSVPAVFM